MGVGSRGVMGGCGWVLGGFWVGFGGSEYPMEDSWLCLRLGLRSREKKEEVTLLAWRCRSSEPEAENRTFLWRLLVDWFVKNNYEYKTITE